jgi:hypothetical protein
VIPEPAPTFDLWPRVKALSEWPDTDETKVAELGRSYTAMADTYDAAGAVDAGAMAKAWTDAPGQQFTGEATAATREATRLAGSMRELGDNTTRFATTVAETKTSIAGMVERAIPTYGAMGVLPPGVREGFQNAVVQKLAGNVVQTIRNAATGMAPLDEYGRIQQFIFDEMVRNSGSVLGMQVNNAIPLPANKALAYAEWVALVRPDGPWDHKGRILDQTEGTNLYTPMPGGGNIRYDLWSNLHYGYVGREAGFTEVELRAGANAADLIGQDRTDPGDDVAVRIGTELRAQYAPDQLRPEHIQQAIERHRPELEQTGMIGPRLR